MQLITLDYETYFDDEYSLKKMTTEEYVRSSRFKVHCVGVKKGKEPAYIERGDLSYLNGCAVLCHHAHFDGLILSHHYGVKPAFWFDTLSMARMALPHLKSHSLEALAGHFGLGMKTIDYNAFKGKRELDEATQYMLEEGCKHDVELTYAIFKKLLPFVSLEELRVIDLTIRMFTEPALRFNSHKAKEELEAIKINKERIISDCGVTKEQLSSSKKFSEILISLGIEVPMKVSPTTGKLIPALSKTDEGMKALLDHENETVQVLVAARLEAKSTINETRLESLLGMDSRGPLTVYLKYYGAHTGRFSGGGGVNFQNFPRSK